MRNPDREPVVIRFQDLHGHPASDLFPKPVLSRKHHPVRTCGKFKGQLCHAIGVRGKSLLRDYLAQRPVVWIGQVTLTSIPLTFIRVGRISSSGQARALRFFWRL